MTRSRLETARSWLFVPGDRPERFSKASAAGADLVVLDLEDAVAPSQKASARGHVARYLAGGADAVVRVNAAGTEWYAADIEMLSSRPTAVMLPKCESPDTISRSTDRLATGSTLVLLIETAMGLLATAAIARSPGVARLALGSVDLATELGVDETDRAVLDPVRSHLVIASAAAGLAPPVDGVHTALDDGAGLRSAARSAARLGFTGMLCVHPRQVEIVNQAFTPSAGQLDWARRVLDAGSERGVFQLDGRLVDKPVVARARRLLGGWER